MSSNSESKMQEFLMYHFNAALTAITDEARSMSRLNHPSNRPRKDKK